MSLTPQDKREIVFLYKSGKSSREIGKIFHIGHHRVLEFVTIYDMYGSIGVERTSHNIYSPNEKITIVKEYHNEGLSLYEICAKYNVSRTTFKSWLQISKGDNKYIVEKLGIHKMGRPKKHKEPQTEIERLQEENLRLTIENELLKKVKALVEARENRLKEIGRKPSKN